MEDHEMNWYKFAQNIDSFYALGLPLPVSHTLTLIKQLVDSAEGSRKEKVRAIENLLGYEKVLKQFRPGSSGFHSNITGETPKRIAEFINWTHSMLPRLQMTLNNPHDFNTTLTLIGWRYDSTLKEEQDGLV